MVSMIAAVVTALISLAGVIYVHTKSETRIEERRRDDNVRNEKQLQLRAVADYISDVYSLNSNWRQRRIENTSKTSNGKELYDLIYREIGDWYEHAQAVYAKTNALHLFLYEEKLDRSIATLFEMTGTEFNRAGQAWREFSRISQQIAVDPSFVFTQGFRDQATILRKRPINDFLERLEAQLAELIRVSRIQFGMKSETELNNLSRALRQAEGPKCKTDPSMFGLGEY